MRGPTNPRLNIMTGHSVVYYLAEKNPELIKSSSRKLSIRTPRFMRTGLCATFLLLGMGINWLAADGIRLRDGMVLPGKPGKVRSLIPSTREEREDDIPVFWLNVAEEQGLIRRYVPRRRDEVLGDPGILTEELYRIPQKSRNRTHEVQRVGNATYGTWNNEGKRTVTLKAAAGPDVIIEQGITRITPRWTTVEGLNHIWRCGVLTSSIPAEALRHLIHANIRPENHLQRLSVARFFNQARMFQESRRELDEILHDFPEQSPIIEEMRQELTQAQAQILLDELRLRYDQQQYQLVLTMGESFPQNSISGGLLEQVEELIRNVRERGDQVETVRALLSEQESKLPGETGRNVAPWRGVLLEQLTMQTVDRLQSFLNLSQGDSLQPEELVSLALSGWILGNENAIAELPATLQLWQARYLILEYVKNPPPQRRSEILKELGALEALNPETLSRLLMHLPNLLETPGVAGGSFLSLETSPVTTSEPMKYAVFLPPEYQPGQLYPVVIELGPKGMPPEKALEWWAGTPERIGHAARKGWIVVAPQYDNNSEAKYVYNSFSHQAVIETLRDIRRRFTIDSNRVFLAGHAKGGEAAWDIGLAHPDLFAGVIPVSAVIPEHAVFCRNNGKYCPLYIIGGELDSEFINGNTKHIQRMAEAKHDLIYVEYLGHGREHFQMEIEMLFDWMSRKKRAPYPREFSVHAVREEDTSYWWWQLAETPRLLKANGNSGQKLKAITLSAKVFPTNSLEINGGSRTHVISLSPELVDFQKRLQVRVGAAVKFNNYLKPTLEAMLEDFRLNADRQRLVWARLEI